MQEARVFYAEDDEDWQRLVRSMLERNKHQLVIEVTELKQALEQINLAQELEINVAVLDSSLNPNSRGDGEKIAAALREKIPHIKIISLSGDPAQWGDVNLSKSDAHQLPEVISGLE